MPIVTRQDGSTAYLPTEEAALSYSADVWPDYHGDPADHVSADPTADSSETPQTPSTPDGAPTP